MFRSEIIDGVLTYCTNTRNSIFEIACVLRCENYFSKIKNYVCKNGPVILRGQRPVL